MAIKERVLTSAAFQKMAVLAVSNALVRGRLIKMVEGWMAHELLEVNPDRRPIEVQKEKLALGTALLHSINKAFKKGHISRQVARGLISNLLGNIFFIGAQKRKEFLDTHDRKPPLFITISPFKGCNLKCIGCYAASGVHKEKLPWDIFDRIIQEAKEFFGIRFFVISGGEPLLYHDQGKTLLDIIRKHSDCFFLIYTNGTLITSEIAKEADSLGNATFAISVEGYEKETDARRGKGVHAKVLQAMANLREAGVPFGISVTAIRTNAELITSEEFFDYYFDQLGALYCWIFQYMPIGRGFTLDLMVTAEQQIRMNHRTWRQVKEKKRMIADFWNSGGASDGCICAAREGGYWYIDWNGDVMPCVFIPYSIHNIIKVYQEGGDLRMVSTESEYFKGLNQWQDDHGYKKPLDPDEWYILWKYVPCPIRHNHGDFRKITDKVGAKPINEEAGMAWNDDDYTKGLIKYGKKVRELAAK